MYVFQWYLGVHGSCASFATISGSYAPDDTATLFHPCRRPSGIPGEDYDTAAGAEARTALVPHFEEKYLQVRQ